MQIIAEIILVLAILAGIEIYREVHCFKRTDYAIVSEKLNIPEGKEKKIVFLSDLHNQGKDVVLVTSGAVAVGASAFGLHEKPTELKKKQACSAVGQARLMMIYQKLFAEYNLEFHEILLCGVYVYMWKGHPLANKKEIDMEELAEYPCLSFEQGSYNSFYFAEEVLSTYQYKRLIKANDRATMLNLMVGLNGFTLCSGIICEELNGSEYCAVKLKSNEEMSIGYLYRKGVAISLLGQKYLDEIAKYQDKAMGSYVI